MLSELWGGSELDRIGKLEAGWHGWNMVREPLGGHEVKDEGRGQLKLVLGLPCQGQRVSLKLYS